MGAYTPKTRLLLNSCHRFFFWDNFISRNDKFSFFFLFKEKRHVSITIIKTITKFERPSADSKRSNMSSKSLLWKTGLNVKSIDFIKWRENIFRSRCKGESHGYTTFLFTRNIINYELWPLSRVSKHRGCPWKFIIFM